MHDNLILINNGLLADRRTYIYITAKITVLREKNLQEFIDCRSVKLPITGLLYLSIDIFQLSFVYSA